jgi:hypothetical protein
VITDEDATLKRAATKAHDVAGFAFVTKVSGKTKERTNTQCHTGRAVNSCRYGGRWVCDQRRGFGAAG